MGCITALGSTVNDIRQNLERGRVVFQRPPSDPSLAVIPVKGFDLKAHTGRCKDARYLNRGAAFATAAAMDAVKTSGLDPEHLENAGLFLACGPNMDITEEIRNIHDGQLDQEGLAALFLLKFLPNTATSLIARLTGVHGENMTLGSACAASLMAIGEAFRKIRDGYLEVALAGGGDSRLSPVGLLSYKKAGALWQGDDPETGYVPFGENPKGFVPGEGGAFFTLESLDHANDRKARIIAEISGYGATLDGHAMTAPRPDGHFAEIAVRKALAEAGLNEAVDLVSAHGTGTALNDCMEKDMLCRVFHGARPPVVAFKSWTGHLASACGAVELALCLACAQTGMFPGIRHLERPASPALNVMTGPRQLAPTSILFENFGFGGQNSALVVEPWI